MRVSFKVKNFLSAVTNLSIGYNEINSIKPVKLENGQIGYRIDSDGNPLIAERPEAGKMAGLLLQQIILDIRLLYT